MWYIYIQQNASLAKINDEIEPFATTWLDLENIILCEINHSEKAKNHNISLMCGIENWNL